VIIPSFHASRVARAAANSGVTPNAVNWANCGLIVNVTTYVYSAQQITGITTPITLQLSTSGSFNALVYKVQSTSTVPASSSLPLSNGYAQITDTGTLTVSNNQWLVFCARAFTTINVTVTVRNTSDGNATLDTFTAQSRHIGGGF
jgi:hypothetical protein